MFIFHHNVCLNYDLIKMTSNHKKLKQVWKENINNLLPKLWLKKKETNILVSNRISTNQKKY